MTDILHVPFGTMTHKRGEDGFLYVTGLVSDDTLDLDQQRMDPDWLDHSIPKWFKSAANVRVMHQPVVGGKAKEIEKRGTGWIATIKVTNPQAAVDIEEGALTGLSIGIKNAGVEKSAIAPNGIVRSGDVVEISLVDRPANPSCVLEIAKSVNGEWEFKGVEVSDGDQMDLVVREQAATDDLEVSEQVTPCAACAGTGKTSEIPGVTCERCGGSGEEPTDAVEDDAAAAPSNTGGRDSKENLDVQRSVQIDKKDYTDAERKDMASKDQAMPGGGFPIKTVADLKNAIQSFGRAKDPAAAKAHIKARAKALGRDDLIPDNWKMLDKSDQWTHDPAVIEQVRDGLIELLKAELDEFAKGEDETSDVSELMTALNYVYCWWQGEASEGEVPQPFTESDDNMAYIGLGVSPDLIKSVSTEPTDENKNELRTEIRKALGVDEEIATYKALVEEQAEALKSVKAELDQIAEMAAPTDVAVRKTTEQSRRSSAVDSILSKAADLRARAEVFTGPVDVKRGFIAEAERLEALARN